ncbi:hypothetical protein ACIBJI_10830 [Nocardia sp. NPDC050408]|uniref:hypothetical protein n=1 Tax=unclassified Nocardia TaxID=2637762 RepID=UPI00343D3295
MAARAAVIAIAVLAPVVLTACGSSSTTPAAPSAPASAPASESSVPDATVPGPATFIPGGAGLRRETCLGWLDFFTEAKRLADAEPGWTAEEAAEGVIEDASKSPRWSDTSEDDRAAMKAGIRDAADGACV